MSLLEPRTPLQGDAPTDGASADAAIVLPEPIGPLTTFTRTVLVQPTARPGVEEIVAVDATDALDDADFQRAFFLIQQLHDRGVEGAAPDAEWHPGVVEWWHRLAGHFEGRLQDEVEVPTVVLGPVLPLIGSIARRSEPVLTISSGDGTRRDPGACDGPMHRTEVRRHPLAHARVAVAAELAATAPPRFPEVGTREPIDVDTAPTALLAACNLTSHLALHRRLLPALLGHLVWHELTEPADPFAGSTHATVAVAYLADHFHERRLAVWGADVTARVEQRLADALHG